MNKNLTRIVCLLDRSGSMKSIREATVAGYNSFIDQLRTGQGECSISLIQFDDEYEFVFDRLPLPQVPTLTDLVPRGNTALLDAQGRAITELGGELRQMNENARPGQVVIVTITDGEENKSRHYTLGQVAQMIEHQQNVYSWNFTYLGANQDAFKVAESMNIRRGSTMSYAATAAGAKGMFYGAANYVNQVRSRGISGQSTNSVSYSDQDRLAATGNDPGTQPTQTTQTQTKEEQAVSSR